MATRQAVAMVHTAASSIFENGSTHDHQKAKVSSTLLTSFLCSRRPSRQQLAVCLINLTVSLKKYFFNTFPERCRKLFERSCTSVTPLIILKLPNGRPTNTRLFRKHLLCHPCFNTGKFQFVSQSNHLLQYCLIDLTF